MKTLFEVVLFGEIIPPIEIYSKCLYSASRKFSISINDCRNKFGTFTVNQWFNLLNK